MKYGLDSITRESNGKGFKVGFETLLNRLQPGDELHVIDISRITRNETEMLKIIDKLIDKKIRLYENGKLVNLSILKVWIEEKDNLGYIEYDD
jgi:hypothetical protein